jgi:hypothetical protein
MNYSNPGQAMAVESDHRPMSMPLKKKKIGFLKKWLLNSVKDAIEIERNAKQEHESIVQVKRQSIGLDRGSAHIDQPERALHFTVYVANGGRVVETRRYDKKTDRNTNGLYVINNDADFGKEIDKIITMEALRG